MNKIVRQINLVLMQEAFNHVIYRRRRIGSSHLALAANAGKLCWLPHVFVMFFLALLLLAADVLRVQPADPVAPLGAEVAGRQRRRRPPQGADGEGEALRAELEQRLFLKMLES